MAFIKGKKKEELTADTILKKIGEYDIYRYYIGKDFMIGDTISSPFRKDKTPSFIIGNRGGFLHHTDYAGGKERGNCFQFVQQLFSISFNQALEKINNDFSLGIIGEVPEGYEKTIKSYSKPITESRPPIIKVVQRAFDTTELAYWNQFHLSEKDLKENNVYAIKALYFNRMRWRIKKTDLVFGYLYGDRWKIYWPYKTKAEGKWGPNNVPNDRMEGLENMKGAKTGLVLKSKKEKMVAQKFLTPHSCHCQNESEQAINPENISFLQEEVDDLFLIFDNDKTGVESCTYYNQFGFNYWNVPQKYRKENIKDIAEYIQQYGPEALRAEIEQKIKL